MSIITLVDMHTGQTLVRYVMLADYPTDEALDAMETVTEFALLRDAQVAHWCRHKLVGGCDVRDR